MNLSSGKGIGERKSERMKGRKEERIRKEMDLQAGDRVERVRTERKRKKEKERARKRENVEWIQLKWFSSSDLLNRFLSIRELKRCRRKKVWTSFSLPFSSFFLSPSLLLLSPLPLSSREIFTGFSQKNHVCSSSSWIEKSGAGWKTGWDSEGERETEWV